MPKSRFFSFNEKRLREAYARVSEGEHVCVRACLHIRESECEYVRVRVRVSAHMCVHTGV